MLSTVKESMYWVVKKQRFGRLCTGRSRKWDTYASISLTTTITT
jgi:hypothetical protein